MINRAETLQGLNVALVVAQDAEEANSPPSRRGTAGTSADAYLNFATSSISPFSRWCMALGLSLAVHLSVVFWMQSEWIDVSSQTQPRPIKVTIDMRSVAPSAVTDTPAEVDPTETFTTAEPLSSQIAQAEQSVPDKPASPPAEASEPSPAPAAVMTQSEPVPAKVTASAAKPQAPTKTQPLPAPVKPSAKPKASPAKGPSQTAKKAAKPRKSPAPAVKQRKTETVQHAPKINTKPAPSKSLGQESVRKPVTPASTSPLKPIKPIEPRVEAAPLPNNPRPRYPRMARKRGQEGQVILRVSVSLEGKADSVEIKTSSGHRLLDQAALKTVKNWRFRPARQGGRSVSMLVDVPVVFRLDS